jgi:hypothetical protein
MGWAKQSLVRLNWKTGRYGAAYQPACWDAHAPTPARPGFGPFCAIDIQCDMSQIHKPRAVPDRSRQPLPA